MRRSTTTCQNLSLRRLLFIFDVIAILIILIIIIVFIAIMITRSYAALQAADLDWIVRPGYKLGRVHFGVFSTSCFVPSALSSDFFTTMYFSPTLLRFSLTFHLLFRTFDVLLGWILLRECLFLEDNIPIWVSLAYQMPFP